MYSFKRIFIHHGKAMQRRVVGFNSLLEIKNALIPKV